jgi:hypothetical protein
MLVRIREHYYLQLNKDVDPSVNSDMLDLAGHTFHIDETYIDNARVYDYRGWKWLGDWLEPANTHTSSRHSDTLCPTQVITPDILNVVERLKSVSMPADLQSITIKGNVPEHIYTINTWDLIFLPRESREVDMQVFVKFSGAVQYNITRYVLRSTIGRDIALLDTREKEHLIPRVLEGLFEAYEDSLIEDANVIKTTDTLSMGGWFNKIYRSPSTSVRAYTHYTNVGYDTMFTNISRMTTQETLSIEMTDHILPDEPNPDRVYASANGFMYSIDRATYDTHFTEHRLFTCPVFGIAYFGLDPVKSVFMIDYFDGQQHIYVSRERILQFDELYERLADSDHEWSSIAKAIYYGRRWYSQAGYERELEKAKAFLQFNLELNGPQAMYIPTGENNYVDDEEMIQEYDYEAQLSLSRRQKRPTLRCRVRD